PALTTESKTVKGVIRDNFGKPLANARIKTTTSETGTISDAQGAFSIAVANNSKLIVSHTGFQEIELLADKENFDIQLVESYLQQPEEIRLLHKTQNVSELLQSTATIHTNQLTTTPAPSFLQALPGRLAGLYTRQRSGV